MPSEQLSRRRFVGNASLVAVSLPVVLGRSYPLFAAGVDAAQAAPFAPPQSPRSTFNFNLDWRFLRDDVKDGEAPGFDDSNWATISTPHSFNDVDSFRAIISHSGGDRGTYKGITWYRKHFKLPAELAGHNLFLEFEGMRQAGDIFLNGKAIGLSENGVNAYGIEITDAVNFGAQENVLAVKVDNRIAYAERATNTAYEWNANDFNPDHGGIDRPYGCMSPARSTRRCRSITASKARESMSTPATSISPKRPPISPSSPRCATVQAAQL